LFSSYSPLSLLEVKEEKLSMNEREKRKNAPKKASSIHKAGGTAPIIRRNDQFALTVTDKGTHQTNRRNLCELVVGMPPPSSPNTPRTESQYRLAIAPTTGQYYPPLASMLKSR
jgi:hypothetical protein